MAGDFLVKFWGFAVDIVIKIVMFRCDLYISYGLWVSVAICFK
jgi:hypothetical protein